MTSWAAFIIYGTVLALVVGELGAWRRRRKHRRLRERNDWYGYPEGVTGVDVHELYYTHPPTIRGDQGVAS